MARISAEDVGRAAKLLQERDAAIRMGRHATEMQKAGLFLTWQCGREDRAISKGHLSTDSDAETAIIRDALTYIANGRREAAEEQLAELGVSIPQDTSPA